MSQTDRIRAIIGDYVDLTDQSFSQLMRLIEAELASPPDHVMAGEKVDFPRILYVCEYCFEHNEEMCGNDRQRMNVAPDGRWLCDDCRDGENIDVSTCKGVPELFTAPPATDLLVGSKAEAFDRIVAARKKHVDAVATYNARREQAWVECLEGNWTIKLDAEYRAMSDAQSEYYRTVQDLVDAALSASEDGVAVSASQDGDHSLTSGRGISQVRPLEDDSTVAPSGDPDFREIDVKLPAPHVMTMREAIANIIDPHSFMPDNSGDHIVGEIVKQSRELALSKADRILAALSAPEAEG